MNARKLILRGYGPLAGLLVVLLFLTLLVPSRPLPVLAPAPTGNFGSPVQEALAAEGATPVTAALDPATTSETFADDGTAPGGGPTTVTTLGLALGSTVTTLGRPLAGVGGPATAASPTTGPARSGLPPVTAAADCSGGTLQDGNTGYSPPCLHWNGANNGGATTRGVTGDTIVVAIREGEQRDENSQEDSKFAKEAKERGLTDTEEDRIRTRDALLEYFNSRYQLYGRKVKLVTYKGRGSMLKELSGGGQEEANADALKVGQEIGAFADLSAITQPYLDALVRQKVVAFGGLHLPSSYYQARAPYAWGQLVDCTALLDSAIDMMAKRFKPGTPAARSGSAAMRNQPRKYGLLVPDDPVYKQCIDDGRAKLQAAGINFAKEIRYGLDFAKMQQEAPNIVAQLKQAGVTTLVLVTDPALPYFLTGAATQQDYWPEWVVTGTVLTDIDILGQFYDQDQWQFASGQSFLGDIFQGNDSESYRAYKAVRPDEPAITRDQYDFSFLMLFIGLQMSGPNLTPQSFQAGMFSYPARNGSLGRWSFSPTDYTAIDDAREIYYDRNALSAFNNRAGRYVSLHGGRRFRGATWPVDANVPVPPPAAP